MPNRLIDETSPYLLQHAHNPVDWYPWGPEALQRAKDEDKPIMLSIGYSACHWCHVMERESFEDEATAELMNQYFINIKVDREERPDLDAVYMEAVQMLTGSGGWPMTVFLTPDGKPFFGGTYFPPVDRFNMPGFPRLLESVARSYANSRDEITRVTGQLTAQMGRTGQMPKGDSPLTVDIIHRAYTVLATNFDYQNGGTGTAPKFPQAMNMEVLLRYYQHGYNERALEMVDLSLEKMAMGGIYDQVAGGFARYSTDAYWLVPHFEKMLYDNALLARLYLHGHLATGRGMYRRITEETLDYILREMTGPEGGFYSATDADSEGEEGKFFVWTPSEIKAVLGEEEGEIFGGFFGVTEGGNFEGKNILNISLKATDYAQRHDIPLERLVDVIQRGKKALWEEREKRVHPLLDDKVLASWNGMMLRSFAEAGAALERQDYLDAAVKNANFLLETMRPEATLLRTYRAGQAKLPGYLEDYAFVADGLLALYEATFDGRWLDEAISLADRMIGLFWDEQVGGFYDTSAEHDQLVVRPRDVLDNAQPCGGSVATDVLLKLAVITGNEDYRLKAATPLRTLHELMSRAPAGTGHWLAALDFYVSAPKEVVIIGPREDPATQALLRTVYGSFQPNKVLVGAEDAGDHGLPLLESRGMTDGKPTAYVCQNYACQLPVTAPEDLAAQLAE
ncbi:MAG TPA: thioredoxin domain-containing protein [Dehalococcoidia bacterium]|nr:thioredoxin domain-containing protein [Chloroflexota bacterium]HCL26493.1 thioredoxin domain-containing protein [Dehalococcoidia bacterium]|tara:strand:- start:3812 stop:5851 length:2040 start_codon:yes stop_codon:yes gene_type:complete